MNSSGSRALAIGVLVIWLTAISAAGVQQYAFCSPLQNSDYADLVFTDGRIYTVDSTRSWAQAIAISQGKILFVGSNELVRRYIGPDTHIVPLSEKMVLPGFHDSHVHLLAGGTQQAQLHVEAAESVDSLVSAVKRYVADHPNDAWIVGSGWSLPLFANANPSKEVLDAVVKERPVFLYSQDGHSAWLNSKALDLAGITATTADPEHGRIERGSNGEPSGTLRESAMELAIKLIPKASQEERVARMKNAVYLANQFGITSVQDADADDDVLDAYSQLQKRGGLNLKVVTALHLVPSLGEQQIYDLILKRAKYTDGRVRATAVKIFVDGVIEAHTAALLRSYDDDSANTGIENYARTELIKLVTLLRAAGFHVHMHAIGDRAIRDSLDAHEAAQRLSNSAEGRHQIAHLELIDPPDLNRFRRLNVIANFEPFWAYNDPYISKCTVPVLGTERSSRLYQIHSMMSTGATVAAGSDWPVTTLNPLDAIQVAVTRQALNAMPGASWVPEERVSLPEILAAYTINGAFANQEEHETGSLEAGKAADLIVLDQNLFDIPAAEIHKTKVLLTMLDGHEVYRHESFPDINLASASR